MTKQVNSMEISMMLDVPSDFLLKYSLLIGFDALLIVMQVTTIRRSVLLPSSGQCWTTYG
jgi:hypothetical protein